MRWLKSDENIPSNPRKGVFSCIVNINKRGKVDKQDYLFTLINLPPIDTLTKLKKKIHIYIYID